MAIEPLNGTKTHPLTEHAKGVLAWLAKGDKPAQEVNAGVVNRLMRESLAETYSAPTPYKTRKGNISWLRITDAGRSRLTSPDPHRGRASNPGPDGEGRS